MLSVKVRGFHLSAIVLSGVLTASILIAQAPKKGPVARFTATTENVGAPGKTVTIEIFGWSTDADRDLLAKAWDVPPPTTPPPSAAPAAPAPAGARGNRGGGNRGQAAAPVAVPLTPSSSLAAALQKAPTQGIVWGTESAGYTIRYAYRIAQPDGSERIVLATDRKLGAFNAGWKPVGSVAPTDYTFSVIELRLNAKGLGEGKVSVTSPISFDSSSKSLALASYTDAPIILKGVKRQN